MLHKMSALFLAITLGACSSLKQEETVYWINSSKVDCSGVGKMTCLQVQKSDTLDLNADWDLFYSRIDGFDYEPGYLYKLKVKEEPVENPPADVSSIKYTLVKVVEKKADARLGIHNIWVLESISGVKIDKDSIAILPQIELNVAQMKVMGSNGCNRVSGAIKKITDTELEFSPLMETRKMCPKMDIPNQFSLALTKTRFYKKGNGTLQFLDADKKELLSLKNVD